MQNRLFMNLMFPGIYFNLFIYDFKISISLVKNLNVFFPVLKNMRICE